MLVGLCWFFWCTVQSIQCKSWSLLLVLSTSRARDNSNGEMESFAPNAVRWYICTISKGVVNLTPGVVPHAPYSLPGVFTLEGALTNESSWQGRLKSLFYYLTLSHFLHEFVFSGCKKRAFKGKSKIDLSKKGLVIECSAHYRLRCEVKKKTFFVFFEIDKLFVK